MKQTILLTCLILGIGFNSYCQRSPEKYGKNIAPHLVSDVCPIDSFAGAYVIFDFRVIDYDFSDYEGFAWTLTRHLRLKILNKNEFDQGSFQIHLWDIDGSKESIFGLKAASYNIKNGKTEISEIKQRDGIEEEYSENQKLFRFALPNIEEGTVIDVTYKMRSPFEQYLRPWVCQWDIPVLYSEIYIKIPEYFTYQQNSKGYHRLTKSETLRENGSFVVGGNPLSHGLFTKHYIAENIPALKAEKYVDNIENYRTGVEFELCKVEIGTSISYYTTSWDKVIEKLLDASYFGEKIRSYGFYKGDLDQLMATYPEKQELLGAIYSFVQSKIKWNGSDYFNSFDNPRKAYNDQSGRSTDINFLLLNMLKDAGFTALPVALSTRGHGLIFPTFPTMDGFNALLVLVKMDGGDILLDASNPYCPPGVLPFRYLNGKGRIIDKQLNSWVEVKPLETYESMEMYSLKISETGEFNGNINSRYKGYAAIGFREDYDESLSEEKFIEEMEEDFSGLDIINHEISGMDDRYGQIDMKQEVSINEHIDFLGDMISFNPMLFEKMEENPFKLENRKYPVNFAYPVKYQDSFNYQIPDGYEVESLPESVKMVTPDNTAVFMYSINQMNNMIILNVILEIKKDMFLPTEYAGLKEFYNQVVSKESEQIILKKKAE